MIEIFLNFEQITGRFVPWVLVASGAVFIILGLCLWICGLGLRKFFVSLVGLACGIIVGFFVVGRNLFSASLSGALAALIALIIEKVLVVLLAAALAAAITFTIMAEPYYEQTEVTEVQDGTSDESVKTEIDDIPYVMKDFGLDAGTKIKQAGMNIPIQTWIFIAVPAVIFLICGVFLWRFTTSLFFSALGTMIVFLGMILLLSYKGTEPISHISNNPYIAGAVFLAMIGFGTVVQLLLCKKSKKQKITKIKPGKKTGKKKNEPEKIVEHDWRSA